MRQLEWIWAEVAHTFTINGLEAGTEAGQPPVRALAFAHRAGEPSAHEDIFCVQIVEPEHGTSIVASRTTKDSDVPHDDPPVESAHPARVHTG